MICPHCNVGVRLDLEKHVNFPDIDHERNGAGHKLIWNHCPECGGFLVIVQYGSFKSDKSLAGGELISVEKEEVLFPKSSSRPVPSEVPDDYKEEFVEACLVLSLSPKASAALSRRLLQKVLREEFKLEQRNLSQEIDDFIKLKDVPSYLGKAVDAVRNVGNFAAHPLKDTNTGELVDVEPGEADWLLEVLEELFDYTFVQPKKLDQRIKELNKKLSALGKPPMKSI